MGDAMTPSVPSAQMWAGSGIDDSLQRTLDDLPRWLGRSMNQAENIYAYQARGDGVSDDSDAFIAWVRACTDFGQLALLPPGNFRVRQEAIFSTLPNAGDLVIQGAGRGVSQITVSDGPAAAGRFLFQCAFGKSLELRDLSLVGSGGLTENEALLGHQGSGKLRVIRCDLSNCSFSIHNGTPGGVTTELIDSSFSGVQESAGQVIHIPGTVNDVLRVRNCDVSHFGKTGSNQYHAFYTYDPVSVDVDGLRISDGIGDGHAFGTNDLGGSTPPTYWRMRNFAITGCTNGIITPHGIICSLEDGLLNTVKRPLQVNGGAAAGSSGGGVRGRRLRFTGEPSEYAVRPLFAGGAAIILLDECDFEATTVQSVYSATAGNTMRFRNCRSARTLPNTYNNGSGPHPVWIDCEFSTTTGPNMSPNADQPIPSYVGDGTRWYDTTGNILWVAVGGAWLGAVLSALAVKDYTVTNALTDRTYDANATTVDELADVVGTLLADLAARGLIQ